MENYSEELKRFMKHFQANTSVKVMMGYEVSIYPHWKSLTFGQLNCDELREISDYIKKTFSEPGNFSHRLPKLNVRDGMLCLTVDVELINKKIK